MQTHLAALAPNTDTPVHLGVRAGLVIVTNRGPSGGPFEVWMISDAIGTTAAVGKANCTFLPASYGITVPLQCVQLDSVDSLENPTNDTIIHFFSTGAALLTLSA